MHDALENDLEESVKELCIRYGKCIDACKKDAISFRTKNNRLKIRKIETLTCLSITIFWTTFYLIIAII
ncbi:MAG: hypothetical protein ACTSQO_05485 [Candidatus Helarchaeota archaeon]